MKNLIQTIIQRRNPQFQFDAAVTSSLLIALFLEKSFGLLRGLKVLLYLKKPNGLLLGKGVSFFHASNISFGKWVKIDDYTRLSALGKGQLSLGNNVGIGAHSRIIISTSFNLLGSHISLGNNVGIGEFAYLGGGGGLDIGDDCIIGQYFSCHPENHRFDSHALPIRQQGVTRQGIRIGNNCWIGSKVTVLDGVQIGNNCVIAAGAVVTTDIPENSVAAGVPARVIKNRTATHKRVA